MASHRVIWTKSNINLGITRPTFPIIITWIIIWYTSKSWDYDKSVTASPYRQVLQQAAMLLELVLERLVGDRSSVLRVCVLEECHGQVVDLLLTEAQVVLLHACLDHVLQLPMLDQTVSCTMHVYMLLASNVSVLHLSKKVNVVWNNNVSKPKRVLRESWYYNFSMNESSLSTPTSWACGIALPPTNLGPQPPFTPAWRSVLALLGLTSKTLYPFSVGRFVASNLASSTVCIYLFSSILYHCININIWLHYSILLFAEKHSWRPNVNLLDSLLPLKGYMYTLF